MNVNQMFQEEKCYCKKSKHGVEQCSNKRKEGSYFCGVHMKSIKKFIFEPIVNGGIMDEKGNYLIKKESKINEKDIDNMLKDLYNTTFDISIDVDDEDDEGGWLKSINEYLKNENSIVDKKRIYGDRDELLDDLFKNKLYLSVYTLRQSIKNLGLQSFVKNTKQSRPELIKVLKEMYEMENYYKKNIKSVIKIQSLVRKIQTNEYYFKRCRNDTDIITFDNIWDIPKEYVYIHYDKYTEPKKYYYYAYDIRTIHHIMNTENPTCPYTCREFELRERTRFVDVINRYESKGIKMNMDKIELSPEETLEMRMKDIFLKINSLDNYTDFEWYKRLDVRRLYEFYRVMEDIWVYRLHITPSDKRKYIQSNPFPVSKSYLKNTNLFQARNICLDMIERFITEGISKDERKLGAMWILSALVEVSDEAAEALPHLVQFD